jgi:hypothetical protein
VEELRRRKHDAQLDDFIARSRARINQEKSVAALLAGVAEATDDAMTTALRSYLW